MTDFSFVQITDHHLREHESDLTFGFSSAYAFRATLRHVAQRAAGRADFVVTTGDLVNGGSASEYQAARALLGIHESSAPPGPQRVNVEGLREMPMYFLPGNHDPRDVFFRCMFPDSTEAATTSQPALLQLQRSRSSPLLMNAAFTHKGIRFICLDWGGENRAVAHPAMLEFLAKSLEDGTPAILLMHHAVVPIGIARLDSFLPADLAQFADFVRDRSVLAIFSGHVHATYEARIAGIPVFGLRSTTFSFAPDSDKLLYVLRPPHYRIVTVRDGHVTTEIVEVAI
jgi:3',5'-cyclic-AMP phosphodiesterase